jgi:hypothetical protein
VLMKRRDAIGRAYLPAVNPMTDPMLDGAGVLSFRNAAVDAGITPAPAGYHASWFAFDNATGESRSIGETSATAPRLPAPADLPAARAFVKIALRATGGPPSWAQPVDVYFRRQETGAWRLVGFERLPQPQ